MQGHKVPDKTIEITIDMKESVHHVDICSLFSKSIILSDKVKQRPFLILSDDILQCIQTDTLCRTRFGCKPCAILSELITNCLPVFLRQRFLAGWYGYGA